MGKWINFNEIIAHKIFFCNSMMVLCHWWHFDPVDWVTTEMRDEDLNTQWQWWRRRAAGSGSDGAQEPEVPQSDQIIPPLVTLHNGKVLKGRAATKIGISAIILWFGKNLLLSLSQQKFFLPHYWGLFFNIDIIFWHVLDPIPLCGGQFFMSPLTWIRMICKAWWTVFW